MSSKAVEGMEPFFDEEPPKPAAIFWNWSRTVGLRVTDSSMVPLPSGLSLTSLSTWRQPVRVVRVKRPRMKQRARGRFFIVETVSEELWRGKGGF